MQREIVTFQLGGVANHVGTHWWNLQEAGFIFDPALLPQKEVENDILFRLGLSLWGQETYTPRLLLCDVRTSLRTELSHRCEVDTWTGPVEIMDRGVLKNNSSSNGEGISMDTTESETETDGDRGACNAPPDASPNAPTDYIIGWSDYLVTELHPRSVCCLPRQVEMGFPQTNSYCMGSLCMQSVEFSQLIENRLHFFVEDCDNLQGFQLLSSLEDGFGSLGSQLLHSLSDEFHKKGKYCIPFLPPLGPSSSFDTFSSHLTLALNLSDWLEHASMLSLLSSSPPVLPFLSHQSLPHQTAAVLAAAIDTCSLIYRVPKSGLDLQDYISLLTPTGRKLTSLSTLLPLPLLVGSTLLHSLSLCPLSSGVCLTPSLHPSTSPITACNVVRGIPPSYRLFDAGASSYDSFTSLDDVISHEFGSRYTGCTSFSMLANSPLPLRYPFPRIFSTEVNPNGLITSHQSSGLIKGNSIVNSVPVSTSIENHNGLYALVNSCVQLFDRKTYVQIFSIGQELEMDSVLETRHSLLDLLDRYPVPDDAQSQSDTDSN